MARTPAMMAISQALANPKRDDPGRRWAEVLREIPLFAGVPRRHVAKIAALTREARYRPGTAIVRAGARGDDFFVILEGTASVVRQQGLPSIPLQPGSYFGEMALLDGEARSASVVAETDVLCLRLSRVPFLRMVRGEPEVAAALLRQLAGRIRELQSRSQLTA
jgi:CRP-like cAMP-binding protein